MRDLTKGNEGRQILMFAIPMLIGNVFQQLYNVVDSIVVGKYVGSVALAAVGASFPILFTIAALIGGITIGGSVLVAQYFGAKNDKAIKVTSDTMNSFLLISAAAFSILFYLISRPLFELLSIPPEVLDDAVRYFDIIILTTTVPSFAVSGMSAILRGVGNSKIPVYFLIISLVVNTILDLVFVLVFDWGIAGVAWATTIANLVAWFALVYYLDRRENCLIQFSINVKTWEFDWDNFRLALRIGLPSGIQHTLIGLGGLALLSIVSPFGVPVLAAYTAAGRVDMFVSMPAMNLAAALSSFVGQNLGADRLDRIKKGLRSTLLYSTLISLTLTIVVIFFGGEIMGLFTDPRSPHYDQIIEIGKEYLVIISTFYLIFTTMFVINSVARGAGATFVPMIITTLSLWVVRVPLALWLSRLWGPSGIWWSIPIGWSVGLIGALLYYWSGKWLQHRAKTTR